MRLRHRLPPQSRLMQSIPSWVDPEALLAMQFGPDRYWRSGAGLLPSTSVLTTTRSSGINLPNTAGVYQSLGINTLPRTDIGLNANPQIVNTLARLNPTVAQLTNSSNVADGDGFAGQVGSIFFAGGGGGVTRLAYQVGIVADNVAYAGAFLIQMLDGEPPVFSGPATGSGATFAIVSRSAAADTSNTVVKHLRDDIWRVSVLETTGVSGSSFGLVQYNGNQSRAFRVCGFQCFQSTFLPDALVPGSSDTGGATLFASDIRAVQGVRPSNSQPEPFQGWEVAGLDSAFGGKNIVTIDRLNAAAPRFITGAGVDADNLTKLIFDTDTRFKLIVRKSAGDEVALQTGAVASTGDKTIEWQAKPGDYGIDATGVSGDTDSDAETLPTGATTLRVGSDFGVLNPFNGWIKELQILKVAA